MSFSNNMNPPNYPLDFSENFSQIGSGMSSSGSIKRKAEESEEDKKAACLAEQRFNGSDIEEPPSKRRKSENFSQIGSEMSSSGSVKRKAEESENEEDKKAACLAEQRFNGSNIEEPPSKRRKIVEGSQKGKEKIDEDEETPKQLEETNNSKFSSKDDSLDRLYACQTILCKDNQQIEITESEKTLLKQTSPILGSIFKSDSIFEEADNQKPIHWTITPEIFGIFLRSLYQSKIVLDERLDKQNELNEEKKEKIFIELLDQANLWETEKLKEKLIIWFLKKLYLLGLNELNHDDLAKVVQWHTFARSRELTSLQESCEDFLIGSFLDAEGDKEKHLLIETLKTIQLTRLDVSAYLDNINLISWSVISFVQKVAYLINQFPLTELNLGSCRWLTDSLLEKLLVKGLPLKELTIVGSNITDNGLIHLQGFKNLRVLNLSQSKITGTGFIHLKDLSLQTLILDDCKELKHEGIAHLKHFKNLQKLKLYIYTTNENILAPLADLPDLRILHLLMPIDINHLAHLKKLPLEELMVYYEGEIVSQDLKNLEGLPLRKLSLISDDGGIDDEALFHLKTLDSLEELTIFEGAGPTLTNAGIAYLSHLFSLKKLSLDSADLSGACLNHLQNLPLLEELSYKGGTIKDGDLENLKGLLLRKLSLTGESGGIEDSALTHLKTLHSLEELEIRDEYKILTDAGVAHLSHLSSLTKLKLEGDNLTEACFSYLQNLSRLEEFTCLFPIKDEDLSYLKEKLPSLKIKLE